MRPGGTPERTPTCSTVTETDRTIGFNYQGLLAVSVACKVLMSHTFVVMLVHCVFSTKNRRKLIAEEVQPKLWPFVGGIARKNGFKALVVGGAEDHLHVLLSLPATIPLARAVQLLKGASSRWMNGTQKTTFAWQEGYGAFSIGVSQKPGTVAYIQSQREHHRRRDFREEFLAFLKKHGVEYDPRYVCE